MANKKAEPVKDTEEFKFSKEKILKSKKYKGAVDILEAALENDKQYSFKEIDKIIEKYKKGTVI